MKKFAGLMLLVMPACMVGPRYKKANVVIPTRYKHQQGEALPQATDWKSLFNDPCLDELMQKALNQNYDLGIAREKIQQARYVWGIRSAELAPLGSFDTAITRLDISRNLFEHASLCVANQNVYKTGFDVSWELDLWGGGRRAKSAALHQLKAQIDDVFAIRLTLLGDIAKTYIDIRSSQQKIDLFEREVGNDETLLTLYRNRFASGLDSDENMLKQEAQLASSRNALVLEKTILEKDLVSLAILIGENVDTFTLCAGARAVPNAVKSVEVGLPSTLLRRRPDIRKAEKLAMAAHDLVGEAIAGWFPKISLLGSIKPQSNKISNWFSNDSLSWSIGPSISWPIITFGRIKYNIKEKDSQRKQATLTYAKTVLEAFGDVESSLIDHFQAERNVALLQKKARSLAANKARKQALFKSGLAPVQDFLIADQALLAAQLELTDAQRIVSTSLISLYKALGGAW